MKKLFSTLLIALIAMAMVTTQTVTISNELLTEPMISVGGDSYANGKWWGYKNGTSLRDEVVGEGITADGRARVKGRIRFDVNFTDPTINASLLTPKPRISWGSAADALDGNRSAVAAILKPTNYLEIGLGNLHDVGYAFSVGSNPSACAWTDPITTRWNVIPGLAGQWQNANELVSDGIYVAFTGVDNLKIGVGLRSADTNFGTMVKKSVFKGPAAAVTYTHEKFDVGAKVAADFGGINAANETDKAYREYQAYAAFAYKGLQEAKVGTTLHAGAGVYTNNASTLLGKPKTTTFLLDLGSDFNFRNGISDSLNVSVGYGKIDGVDRKTLPFAVKNILAYTVQDAKFAVETVYAQTSFNKRTKDLKTNESFNGIIGAPLQDGGINVNYDSLIAVNPSFQLTQGAHTFKVGVNTAIYNDLIAHEKTASEWRWTGVKGVRADVSFPISWKYNFL